MFMRKYYLKRTLKCHVKLLPDGRLNLWWSVSLCSDIIMYISGFQTDIISIIYLCMLVLDNQFDVLVIYNFCVCICYLLLFISHVWYGWFQMSPVITAVWLAGLFCPLSRRRRTEKHRRIPWTTSSPTMKRSMAKEVRTTVYSNSTWHYESPIRLLNLIT